MLRLTLTVLFRYPALYRVLDSRVDLLKQPATREELLFVNLVIQHLAAAYHAMRDGLFVRPEGMRRDVAWFFSLPIPKSLWEKFAPLQDQGFVEFVEQCRGWK